MFLFLGGLVLIIVVVWEDEFIDCIIFFGLGDIVGVGNIKMSIGFFFLYDGFLDLKMGIIMVGLIFGIVGGVWYLIKL